MGIDFNYGTLYIGRLCGGRFGLLLRWFGRSDVERWRIVL
jgi:hypothetical protein